MWRPCKRISVWFPWAESDSGRQEFLAVIPKGCRLGQLQLLDSEFARHVLVHPHSHTRVSSALYDDVRDGDVLFAIPKANIS